MSRINFEAIDVRPRNHGFYLGQQDDAPTRAQVAGMQAQLRHVFQAYGMDAVNFEATMNVHGGRDWRLTVNLRDDAPPMEVRTFGSAETRYIEGRRGATAIIEGDNDDLVRAGSENRLFESIARALDHLVRRRTIRGETINVSCHELLHRYDQRRRNGEDYDYYPLHLRTDFAISQSANELREHWGFSEADVQKAAEKFVAEDEAKANGPTEDELEASYRV
jgi:hypothetical protein